MAGIEPETVRAAIFDGDLLQQLESGRLSSAEFYEAFCAATGRRPAFAALAAAASEIFSLNLPVLPIVAGLQQAGYRMGILSNTCELHWDYCGGRYRVVGDGFGVQALSFRIGAAKPEAAMFHAAAKLAGLRPEEIFYVDDMPQHVAGARAVGSMPCGSPRRGPWPANCASAACGGIIEPRAIVERCSWNGLCPVLSPLSTYRRVPFPDCRAPRRAFLFPPGPADG